MYERRKIYKNGDISKNLSADIKVTILKHFYLAIENVI